MNDLRHAVRPLLKTPGFTRETAIRMARGSRRGGVAALIVGERLRIAAVGLGLVVALLCAHPMQSLLLGVGAFDVGVFALNAAIVAAVAVLATRIPALCAARAQPVGALR